MKPCWILFPLALLLTACTQLQVLSGMTFDHIDRELKEAATSKPAAGKNDALNNAMLPPLQIETPKAAALPEPRFDLAVTAAPAAQVFTALVAGTRYSMLIPPEVTGAITLNLKSVTVREALEAIRELYGFEFSIKGNRIVIQPNTMQTRMFQINYLASQRLGRTDVRVTSSSSALAGSSPGVSGGQTAGGTTGAPTPGTGTGGTSGSGVESSRITTQSGSDFWKELNATLSALVGTSEGRAVIINAHSGVVLVKAMPGELRAVENYLKATQLIVERQVMLEAKIIEVQLSEGAQSGVNWASFGNANEKLLKGNWAAGNVLPGTTLGASGSISGSAGSASSATSVNVTPGLDVGSIVTGAAGKGFFGLAFQARDFAAMLSFLETQGDVQVLSSPRVATLNNQKAVLKVGTDEYFVTNVTLGTSTNTTGGTNTPPSVTLQPFFSGVALDVMPQIDEDNNIILHIHPTVSKVSEKEKRLSLGGGDYSNVILPLASSEVSESDSVVRVQNGHIVAIGGLIAAQD